MKKLIYSLIFILFLLPVTVFAENEVEVKSISLLDKSENTVINNEATTDGVKINLDLVFYDVDDYATYTVVVTNPNNVGLYINDQIFKSGNEHISYQFTYSDNSNFIKPGEEKTIKVKVSYSTEVDKKLFVSAKYEASNNNPLILSDKLIQIPNTLKNLGILGLAIISFTIVCIIVGMYVIIKNKKVSSLNLLVIILLLFIVPKYAGAIIEVEIPVDSKINIRLVKPTECTYEGNLVLGATYINGQYTYKYMQKRDYKENWINMTEDGWGVMLTDKESTDPVTSKLCTYINGKPLLSIAYGLSYSQAEEIDVSSWDTSNIDSFRYFFYNSKFKKIDAYYFDTSNAWEIAGPFHGMTNLETIDISMWDTSKVTYFYGMFYSCSNLTYANIDNLNMSKNRESSVDHFDACVKLKEISARNVIMGRYGNGFFDLYNSNPALETVDITGMDLTRTEQLNRFFNWAKNLKNIIGLNTLDTSNIKEMYDMFYNCYSLKKVDLSSFDMSGITATSDYLTNYFFFECKSLNEIVLPKAFPNIDIKLPSFYLDDDDQVYYYMKDNNKPGEKIYIDGVALVTGSYFNTYIKELAGLSDTRYYINEDNLTGLIRADSLPDESIPKKLISLSNSEYEAYLWLSNNVIYYYTEADKIYFNPDSNYMFGSLRKLENIDIDNFNTIFIKSTNFMFYNTSYLYEGDFELDLSNKKFENLTSSREMFNGMAYNANSVTLDLTGVDFANDTNLEGMFKNIGYNSKNVTLNLNNLKFPKATNIQYIFDSVGRDADKLTINAKNWKFGSLTSLYSSFSYAGCNAKTINIDLSNWDTENITNIEQLFYTIHGNGGDITVNLSNWNTSNVTNMKYLFYYLGSMGKEVNIIGIDDWNTANVTNFAYAFYNVARDATKFVVDLSSWDVSSAQNMFGMFAYSGTHATTWSIGKLDSWNPVNATNMNNFFRDVGYDATNDIDIGTINIYSTNIDLAFSYFKNVKAVVNIHNKPVNYNSVFSNCAINKGNVIVNYTSAVDNIDDLIATKDESTNVHKGELID